MNQSGRASFSTVSRQNNTASAGLDGGKLTAATCMPLQALFPDEMIDNDTELIALNSNDDDIFYLISLRRNHKDHVPRIREYYEEVIPRYTDLQLDLQFRHHFRMSRPTVQQLCFCWVIALRFRVNSTIVWVDRQFNFENKSL